MSKPVDVVASTASASSYSSVSTPATYLPQHIEILRNHWSELRRRLHAITVVHKLFQEKVVSHEELEDFVGREESRHQAADRLLMLMLTRSWDHFLVFGKVLSQTTGIDDLGNKLVDEAESAEVCADDKTSKKELSARVTDLELRLRQEKEKHTYLQNRCCRAEAECTEIKKNDNGKNLLCAGLRLAPPDLLRQGSGYVCPYQWKIGPCLPKSGMFFNRFVVAEKKAIAADWRRNLLYLNNLCEEQPNWRVASNTYEAGHIYRLFTVGDKCFGTFYKEDSEQEQSIASYNIEKNTWMKVADIPSNSSLQWYGIVSDSDRIYIVGGWDANWNCLDTMLVYDVQTGKLCDNRKMLYKRRSCSCAIVNKTLYVAGGYCGQQGLNYFESLSLNDYACHRLASTETYRCSISEFCGQMVVTGGTIESGDYSPSSNLVAVFDSAIDVWVPSAPMISKRLFHGMYTFQDEDKLFVVGGDDCVSGKLLDLNSVECLKL